MFKAIPLTLAAEIPHATIKHKQMWLANRIQAVIVYYGPGYETVSALTQTVKEAKEEAERCNLDIARKCMVKGTKAEGL